MLSRKFIEIQRQRLLKRQEEYSALIREPWALTPHDKLKLGVSLDYIQSALEAINDGAYGRCQECGQWIPKKRLQAVPGAIRCIGCQNKHEAGKNE